MNDLFSSSVMFGLVLTLFSYWISLKIQKKTKFVLFNPLLISSVLIIVFLVATKTSYETFWCGNKYITDFLTPATVCLAVPMYKQIEILKKNYLAVLCGILAGCIAHAVTIAGLAAVLAMDKFVTMSVLPKSVTTAIAIGVCDEIGGNSAIVIIGVCIAGTTGAILGPVLLEKLGVKENVAQGLAIGTCSHAMGTSTAAVPMGEVQGAMSSLAIVVTGIMTVVIVPIVVSFLK